MFADNTIPKITETLEVTWQLRKKSENMYYPELVFCREQTSTFLEKKSWQDPTYYHKTVNFIKNWRPIVAERSKNKKRNLIEYFGAWRVPPSTPPGLSPRTCWASPDQSIKGANYFLLYAPPEPVTTTVSMAWILSIPSNSHQPRFRGGKPS